MGRTPNPPDELDDIFSAYETLKDERDNLKRSCDVLGDELAELKEKLNAAVVAPAKPEGEKLPNSAGLLILVLITIVLARLALFVGVEKSGAEAPYEGFVANLCLGGAAAYVLFQWAKQEWDRFGLLMFPNALVISVTLITCLNLVTGGFIFNGRRLYELPDAGGVCGLAIFGLFLGSTKFWAWLLKFIARLLNDPLFPLRAFEAWDAVERAKEEKKKRDESKNQRE